MTSSDRPTPRILVFFNDAGGGHRAAAQAIETIIRDHGAGHVTLVNPVQTLFGPVDWFRRFSARDIEAFYNEVVLGRSWGTLATTLYYGVSALNLWMHRQPLIAGLRRLFESHRPDIVISLLPGINHLLVASVRSGALQPALVFVNTDLEETFRWSWFPRRGAYYAITGTARSHLQALRTTGAPARVFRTSGLLVRPAFYAPASMDIAGERTRLGLDPQRLTLCVLYGGAGSERMESIADWLAECAMPVQAIFLCGRNTVLADRLRARPDAAAHLVVDFTTEVPRYIDVADVVVGKSGPGVLSEALVRRRPVLVDRRCTMPQERYNARWVVESGVGLPFSSRPSFVDALRTLTSPDGRARLTARLQQQDNRAILELPEILQQIVAREDLRRGRSS